LAARAQRSDLALKTRFQTMKKIWRQIKKQVRPLRN
jgi:hypothetical protein